MAIEVFLSYAHQDEPLLQSLVKHLQGLQRPGYIDVWYDRDISAGTEREKEIHKHLNTAQIILLLITHGSLKSGRKNEKLVNSGNERSPEH
ncbi:MAG: toll/interleukin-1 receptor domain-containing protein [Chloroflexi bacterium]|nr:MAG: toll/interleukin-1 receptor domain-containing protein [Chloroflexota bacterium]